MKITEIAEPVKEFFENFDSAFEGKFHSQVPLVDKVINYIAAKRGKRLRPLLVFLTAKLHGELVDKSTSAALVVEMFHTATLVHDDVVDESNMRRGSRTVNDVWDNKISILIGDLLFSKTLASIVDLQDNHAVAILSDAAERITEGELLQIAFTEKSKISEEEYFDLISKKTAALFSASCQMGALSVKDVSVKDVSVKDVSVKDVSVKDVSVKDVSVKDVSVKDVSVKDVSFMDNQTALDNMFGFGENYGIAFQIMDDVLDYLGDTDKLGKPTGNDLKEGKVTLPLIHALNSAPQNASDEILGILDRGIGSDEDIKYIVNFVSVHGGVDYAMNLVRKYTADSLEFLKAYPESAAKRSLVHLVDYSINRDE